MDVLALFAVAVLKTRWITFKGIVNFTAITSALNNTHYPTRTPCLARTAVGSW